MAGERLRADLVDYAFRASQYSVSDIGYLSAPTRTYTSIGFELLIDGVCVREGTGPHVVISDYEFEESQPGIPELPEPYAMWVDLDPWQQRGEDGIPIEAELIAGHVVAHQHELIALFHRVEAMRAIALGECVTFRGPRDWTVPIPSLEELNAWASGLAGIDGAGS